ncbi:unnamed protein product [Paramecium pentaurelia]|uniref:Uncharacterized protein n=1 Tax=Paramecium pentaurelia TaxID=43138 RepID=A0A8S1TSW6_9CILI|nr:unnamed protein product [Paramecium pentaurelia]
MINQQPLQKRTPISNVRKATLIKDEVDNYKVYRFELFSMKKNISLHKNHASAINFQKNDILQDLNQSCICEECGGRIAKQRIMMIDHLDSKQMIGSQKQSYSPPSQNRHSVIDSSLLGSQQISDRQMMFSLKKSQRRSIKPVLQVIQAQNMMKKMVNSNQLQARRSLQSIENPEPLFEKVQIKLKSQFRRSINNSPIQIRTRTDASTYLFPLLAKSKTQQKQLVNQKPDFQIVIKKQPQLLKSEKLNQIKTLQQRLLLTYLKKSQSQQNSDKINILKYKLKN